MSTSFYKVNCLTCHQVTPHEPLSDCHHREMRCEVCRTVNFPLSPQLEAYSLAELASFWQAKYRATLAEKRVVLASNKPYPADVVSAQPANHDQGQDIVVNGRMLRFGLDSELNTEVRVYEVAQRQPDSQGDILLAEPIPGGIIVSKAPPLPLNEGFATDFTALREEIVREGPYGLEYVGKKEHGPASIDPNTMGTL